MLFQRFKGLEQTVNGHFVGFLGTSEPRLVNAVIDIRIDDRIDLVYLAAEITWVKVDRIIAPLVKR